MESSEELGNCLYWILLIVIQLLHILILHYECLAPALTSCNHQGYHWAWRSEVGQKVLLQGKKHHFQIDLKLNTYIYVDLTHKNFSFLKDSIQISSFCEWHESQKVSATRKKISAWVWQTDF